MHMKGTRLGGGFSGKRWVLDFARFRHKTKVGEEYICVICIDKIVRLKRLYSEPL